MKGYKKFFWMMFFMMLFSAFTALVAPFLLNLWSGDAIGINGKRIVILVIAMTVSMLIEILLIVLREKFAKSYNKENFKKFLTKLLAMNYDATIEQGPANLIQRIQQAVGELYNFMTGSNITIWSNSLALVVILAIIARKSLIVGGIMLLMIPVNYFGYKLLNKELAQKSKKLQKNSALGYQKILSCVQQTDYLKQCGDHEELIRHLNPAYDLLYESMAEINIFARSVSAALRSVNQIARTVAMVLLVIQYTGSESDTVTLVLVTILFPMYFTYLNQVTNANLSRQGLNASMEFVDGLDKKKEKSGQEDLEVVETVKISIPKLTIGERILAENLEGDFKRGDVVWVRGASGAGKSTLVKQLVKFRECEGIMINGRDINLFSNSSVRKRMNYFSQNVPVIEGTVRDNLSFNRPWSREKEEKLLKDPFFGEFFRQHDFDSKIEENGANLSGGEKQKLALAGAFYDDVDVLILDEFTSNIDKEAAEEIFKKVMEKGKNQIIFIISHDDLPEKYATKTLYLHSVSASN